MGKRYERNTKSKIVQAAWKLFNEQGYDNTTIEDIVELSGTSRGSFYHYFDSKDSVIASMTFVLDDEYKKIIERIPDDMSAYDTLLMLNLEICKFIENQLTVETAAQLFGSQLGVSHERIINNRDRYYYKLLRSVIEKGIANGEITGDYTVNEVMNAYSVLERGLVFDWCLCDGEYNLAVYSQQMLPMLMKSFFRGFSPDRDKEGTNYEIQEI